jgi:hypothetical protein
LALYAAAFFATRTAAGGYMATTTYEERQYGVAYGGILGAIRMYPVVLVVCALFGTLVGLGIGALRDPTYTATSQLLVGNLSISDPAAVPGAVGASQALASVYSRLIDANDVRADVAKQTKGENGTATVSATQIVQTPLIQVKAQSDSERAAVRYANAAGAALASYVNHLKSPGSDTTPLAARYQAAQLAYSKARDKFEALQQQLGPDYTAAEQAQVNEAESAVQAAKLKRNSIGAIYQRGQNVKVSQPELSLFKSAVGADSDRTETMEITGAVGLAAGLLLGAALAVSMAARRVEVT